MRIADTKNYIMNHEKVTEDEVMAANDNGQWCWEMKNFRKGDDSVTLYHLDESKFASRALKECWVVAYTRNNIGTRAIFDDEVEAIDFTLKIINLIKA